CPSTRGRTPVANLMKSFDDNDDPVVNRAGSAVPRKTRRLRGQVPDPTANAVIRRLVDEPDFYLPASLLATDPELEHAMQLPMPRLTKEYIDALIDLTRAEKLGRGTKQAAEAFLPLGWALALRRNDPTQAPEVTLNVADAEALDPILPAQ